MCCVWFFIDARRTTFLVEEFDNTAANQRFTSGYVFCLYFASDCSTQGLLSVSLPLAGHFFGAVERVVHVVFGYAMHLIIVFYLNAWSQ